MKKLIILLSFLSLNSNAAMMCTDLFQDPTEYLFGLEFTFTTQDIVNEGNRNPQDPGLGNNPIKAKHWNDWMEIVKAKCVSSRRCTTHMTRDKHGAALAVVFKKDGFQFTIGIDSAALEVNASPKTRTDFAGVKARMKDFVFATALKAGLTPHERAGQGHIHISTKAFGDNGAMLRNFFVDFQNRPEIIYGALGNHLLNSPPLSAQTNGQRESLTAVLKELDQRESYSVIDFAVMINSRVYTETVAKDWGGPTYYQAFNMTRVFKGPDSATIELRSFRPQASAEMFELQTILLEKWVEKMRNVKTPIAYNNKSGYNFSDQKIVDSFQELLTELELPWDKFKVLLPPRLQGINPTAMK